ncbi:MAG: aspartyl-tRNA amidotransferase subunit B [Porticoccaceae bacterium]|nr:MAG: aspartyl-tRNA amidotransferase subunit B [Porticoccaceae bacterium]
MSITSRAENDMSLKDEINKEMKAAMKSRDKDRLKTIRLILSEIKRVEVDERITVDDQRTLSILAKMIKQRRDSIAQYDSAGRTELSKIETDEITVINEFLPEALTDDEINNLIEKAISETGAESMKDMGRVMGIIRPQIQGRADAGEVSKRVKEALNS